MSAAAEERRWLTPPPGGGVRPLAHAPSFSMVIPAYQAAQTIGRAIESALSQTLPAREVIVVDDGSTDELDEALEPFRGQITLLRKENGGGASAHNTGDAAAVGDYVVTLDADDAFDARRLEALAALAVARPDLDIITTDATFVVDGKASGSFLASNPFAVEDQRAAILRSCFVGGWPAVRRSRLADIGGFDETLRIAYDWDCWLRLILDGSQAGLVAAPYYEYVLHGGSLASSRVASLWERVRLLEKAADNPALRAEERPVLAASLRAHRLRAVQAELRGGPAGSRLRRLALARGIGPALRLRVALAALVPPVARRLKAADPPPEARLRPAP